MALLSAVRRIALALAGLCLVTSCESSPTLGKVEVWLHDCGQQRCDMVPSAAQHFESQAFIDPSASRYAPHGLYAYFELQQPDGTLATVEFDVPTSQRDAVVDFQADYREALGDGTRFEAKHMQGAIVVPSLLGSLQDDCRCNQALFALRFSDPGPDGVVGTDDDRQRDLLQGRLGLGDHWCASATPLQPAPDLHVTTLDCAAPDPVTLPPPSDTSVAVRGGGSVYVTTDTALQDDGYGGGGCASDSHTYDDRYASSSSGCGQSEPTATAPAPATSEPSSSDSGACEGDRYDGDDSSCSGDRDAQDNSSCKVAAQVADRRAPARRRGANPLGGLGIPLLLAYCALALQARRGRPHATRAIRHRA